jgi:hypothetical protein
MEREIISIDDENNVDIWLAQEVERKKLIDTLVHEGNHRAADKMVRNAKANSNNKSITTEFHIGDVVKIARGKPGALIDVSNLIYIK